VPAQPEKARGAQAASVPDDWHLLIPKLNIGGLTRELAHHCEWIEADAERVKLRLAPAHRQLLLNRGAQDKLQAALAAHFGRALRLEVEVGEQAGATPAQRRQSEQQERHEKAVASLEQDAFVRNVIDIFDATINESSVRPL
jgi:DNA polymerase-3 subunit gamma/tau